jgi:type I restriction enzyme S subunit
VPYLRVANVHRGRLDLTEIKTLRATEAEVARTLLEEGDLLFVEGHANPLEVGRVAVWSSAVDGCVHQNHLIRARLNPTQMLPGFASAWLNSSRGAVHFLRSAKTTSGLNTISASTVRSAPVPRVPLDDQRRFVAAVDRVRQVRTAVEGALAAHDELFASLKARAFQGEL